MVLSINLFVFFNILFLLSIKKQRKTNMSFLVLKNIKGLFDNSFLEQYSILQNRKKINKKNVWQPKIIF